MKAFASGAVIVLGVLAATPTLAAQKQPPMNNFNSAYYTCDAGGAFLMSYDSTKPTAADMTTSNNSKRYSLKRTSVTDGVQFEGGPVKFWTDGKKVTVTGTEVPLQNCSTKVG